LKKRRGRPGVSSPSMSGSGTSFSLQLFLITFVDKKKIRSKFLNFKNLKINIFFQLKTWKKILIELQNPISIIKCILVDLKTQNQIK
jgi:hypothetical protein